MAALALPREIRPTRSGEVGRPGQGMTVVHRAKRLILDPRAEWAAIDGEPTTIGEVYKSYAIPLALIPAVAGFIGASIVGMGVPGLGNFRVPVGLGLVSALVQFGGGHDPGPIALPAPAEPIGAPELTASARP